MMRKIKKYPSSIKSSRNISFTCPSCGNKTLYCVDHDLERVADVDYHDTFVCEECGYECLSEPKYSGGIRFVKPVDSALDVSDYEELNTGISDGGKNYRLYRKLVDGRGKWAAQETKRGEPVGEPFEITYDQARGYEGINDAGRIGREVGKKLFSRKVASSIKFKEVTKKENGSIWESVDTVDQTYSPVRTDKVRLNKVKKVPMFRISNVSTVDYVVTTPTSNNKYKEIGRGKTLEEAKSVADNYIKKSVSSSTRILADEDNWPEIDEWSRKRGIPFGPDLNDEDWERTHNTYLYEVGGEDAVKEYGSPDYGYLYDVTGASLVEDVDPDDYVHGEEAEDDEADLDTPEQEFTSEKTSINVSKLPAVFKMVTFQPGTINLDYGGGKFDNAAEYLKDQDVTNLVYDPYNRTNDHNKDVIRTVRKNGGADTATCSNVLNVIKEPNVRRSVLENIKKLLKPSGTVYITVYEGSGKGNEGPTKSGYQMNRKTEGYLDEIREVFPDAKRRGKLIVAHPGSSVASAEDLSYDALRVDDTIYDVWSIYNEDGEWVNEDKLETFDNYDEAVSYAKEQSADGPCHIVKIGPDGQEIAWSTEEDEMVVSCDVLGSEVIEGRLVDAPQSVIDELLDILEKYGFVLDPAFDENPGKTWMDDVHLQVINENSSADDTQSLRRYVTREMIDEIHELEDRTDCPITWNFGPNKQGQVTGGLDVYKKYVEDEGIEGSQEINLPGFAVSYASGYAGWGVNHTAVKYFRTEKEQKEFAKKLKDQNVRDVKTYKLDNFYHTLPDNQDVVESARKVNISTLESKIRNRAVQMMKMFGFPDEEIDDYLVVDIHPAEEGWICVEVRAELTYESMSEMADALNPIVKKYDKNAYFDHLTSGIIEAYVEDKNFNINAEEAIEGADYGGAFDIDADQFFTKEEIVEFGNYVVDEFNSDLKGLNYGSRSPYYEQDFYLEDVYMETPKLLHLDVSDGDTSYSADIVVDMRRIRRPADMYKYASDAVLQLEDAYRDYHGLDIDASTDVDISADDQFDGLFHWKDSELKELHDDLQNAVAGVLKAEPYSMSLSDIADNVDVDVSATDGNMIICEISYKLSQNDMWDAIDAANDVIRKYGEDVYFGPATDGQKFVAYILPPYDKDFEISRIESSSDIDGTWYELIEYLPDSGENGMSGDEFSVLDSGFFSSLEEAEDHWSDMLQDKNVFVKYEKSYEDLEPVDSARYDVPEPSLEPPEEREPQEDSFKATIQIDLDDVVVVNGDDIDFEESDPDFALSPDGNDEWTVGEASDVDKIVEFEGIDDIVLDDKNFILENVMDLILPQIPEEDGSYRVRGTVKLVYEVDVTDYLDEWGEEPVSRVADYKSDFKFRESSFENVKITSVNKS